MLEDLREEVFAANLELVKRGLVLYTFGNASGIDRSEALVVIKPSGVPYDSMRPSDLVIVDLEGNLVEGTLRPSSDLPTHLVLYRSFTGIGGVVHTHSRNATSWAQSQREIPCFGTTHADYFHGPVPVTDNLTADEIESDYEGNTGHLIVRRFASLDPMAVPAVLVAGHAPFCWGRTADEAAHIAVVLEEVAAMALQTIAINPAASCLVTEQHDKHYFRKHGAGAYYGQLKDPNAAK
jgi:L-ribulose-5-phosphate 4-epimerase